MFAEIGGVVWVYGPIIQIQKCSHRSTNLTCFIPIAPIETDEFKETVKYLFRWVQHLIKQSQTIQLALFKDKRRYERVEISNSTNTNPNRPPNEMPICFLLRHVS